MFIEKNDLNDWMPKSIEVNYKNLDEYSEINILIGNNWPNLNENYEIKYINKYENNKNKKILINKNEFDEIYKILYKINYNELFTKSAYMVAMGSCDYLTISISLGYQILSFKICSYESDIEKEVLLK